MLSIGRNDPCPCGSGKKYKKCCLPRNEQRDLSESVQQDDKSLLLSYIAQEFQWVHYLYEIVAKNIVNSMYPQYEPDMIAAAIHLWNRYANEVQPIIRKVGAIEASIEYCVAKGFDLPVTQSELAAKYGVSTATISKRVQEIMSEEWLFDSFIQENSGRQKNNESS